MVGHWRKHKEEQAEAEAQAREAGAVIASELVEEGQFAIPSWEEPLHA